MADYIAQLQNYWLKLAADDADITDLTNAQEAMTLLIGQASRWAPGRQQFAQANIFETALDKDRKSDALLASLTNVRSMWGGVFGSETRPPRQIMLDMIRDASNGSWFLPKVEGGIAPWISSPASSVRAFAKTLTDDPNDYVRIAALRFAYEVPIPLVWGQYLIDNQILDIVERSAAGSRLDAQSRTSLQTLASQVKGTIAIAVGAARQSAATARSASGEAIQMMASGAPPEPWYKSSGAGLYAVGALGALLGAFYQRRRIRR